MLSSGMFLFDKNAFRILYLVEIGFQSQNRAQPCFISCVVVMVYIASICVEAEVQDLPTTFPISYLTS